MLLHLVTRTSDDQQRAFGYFADDLETAYQTLLIFHRGKNQLIRAEFIDKRGHCAL